MKIYLLKITMPISTIPFRRSAVYMNKLVSIANAQATLKLVTDAEQYKYELESRRGEDLTRVYSYIETSARKGAVRVFNWDSTPEEVRKLIFNDTDIKNYLTSNGFSYEYDSIEWHAATTTNELK